MSNKTTIISLFAGPGAGKSTSAAYLFAYLKSQGYVCELVQEYVKKWAWAGRPVGTYDQILFLGKQVQAESVLLGKVDVIITDSPVWLCAYYAHRHCPPLLYTGVEAMVKGYYGQAMVDGHRHLNVFMNRTKEYVQKGRYETEEQARDIDTELRTFLAHRGVNLFDTHSSFEELNMLVESLQRAEIL